MKTYNLQKVVINELMGQSAKLKEEEINKDVQALAGLTDRPVADKTR